jgi:predicted amidohydrolase YtcJ
MIDGILENSTAFVHEPYELEPRNCGVCNFTLDQIVEIIRASDRLRKQVHCHVIGDAALTILLDALEVARDPSVFNTAPQVIAAHLQLVHVSDIARLKRLNVAGNFSPFWIKRDTQMRTLTEPRIGWERCQRQYPVKKVLDEEVLVCFGSDWPVSSLRPLAGIQVALTHRWDGASGDEDRIEFLPDEKILIQDALTAYTRASAIASGLGKVSGILAQGFSADFVVLGADPFSVLDSDVAAIPILQSFVRGHCVWSLESANTEEAAYEHLQMPHSAICACTQT